MRLIDANALERKVQRRGAYKICTDDVIAMIADAPTIDAVPVVHGEWTTKRTWEHDGELYCSVCGKSVDAYNDIRWADKMYNYCPNCGAKMDGADGERKDGEG